MDFEIIKENIISILSEDPKAMNETIQLAENGKISSLFTLGYLMLNEKIPQDNTGHLNYLCKAAFQGCSLALHIIEEIGIFIPDENLQTFRRPKNNERKKVIDFLDTQLNENPLHEEIGSFMALERLKLLIGENAVFLRDSLWDEETCSYSSSGSFSGLSDCKIDGW